MVHGKEIELKILDVNVGEVRHRLAALNAKKVGVYNFKRLVFPIKSRKGYQAWMRLRTDGKKTTLTMKKQRGDALTSTMEWEVMVSAFEDTARMLCSALKKFYYVENHREEYALEGTQVTIDRWPMLPALVEIEGSSERKVMDVYRRLGISGRAVGNISAEKVYRLYGIDSTKVTSMYSKKAHKLLGYPMQG